MTRGSTCDPAFGRPPVDGPLQSDTGDQIIRCDHGISRDRRGPAEPGSRDRRVVLVRSHSAQTQISVSPAKTIPAPTAPASAVPRSSPRTEKTKNAINEYANAEIWVTARAEIAQRGV